MNKQSPELFIICADTLEPVLIQELEELGFNDIAPGFRGVYVPATMDAVYRINYCSRIASRVLWPVKKFHCEDQEALYKIARQIEWSDYMSVSDSFAIDANVNHRKLRNSLFATQVVKDAICDYFREKTDKRPNVDLKNSDVRFNLFIDKSRAVISLDTSGGPLFKRGYRTEQVEAPMQETLAAAILRMAGYTGEQILYDPCCGSGTFLVEAAMIASNTAPGFLRKKWGFMRLPEYSREEWTKVKEEIDSKKQALSKGKFFGLDINSSAVQATKVHLRASGFYNFVKIDKGDFCEYKPPVSPDLIICNPPYGKRLGEEEKLRPLYRELGFVMRGIAKRPGKAFVFTGNLNLSKGLLLKPTRRHVMKNAGIECRLLEFDFEEREKFQKG